MVDRFEGRFLPFRLASAIHILRRSAPTFWDGVDCAEFGKEEGGSSSPPAPAWKSLSCKQSSLIRAGPPAAGTRSSARQCLADGREQLEAIEWRSEEPSALMACHRPVGYIVTRDEDDGQSGARALG